MEVNPSLLMNHAQHPLNKQPGHTGRTKKAFGGKSIQAEYRKYVKNTYNVKGTPAHTVD